ncbi:MAG TPA: ComEC/Rec2 family competence protein, partial [Pirellulales bacterium]|nr:ComEC/Rec2 family competence protein [Pirellulales bacterium]
MVAAVCCGILADRVFPLPAPVWWIASAMTWGAWCLAATQQRGAMAALLLCAACAALGGAWHHFRWQLFARDELAMFAKIEGGPVCLRARIAGNVAYLPARPFDLLSGMPAGPRSRVRLAIEAVRDGATWRSASGTTLLSVEGRLPALETGTCVQIVGQLSAIAPPMNPGEFDFAAHARSDRQLTRLWTDGVDSVRIVSAGSGWAPLKWLNRIRAAAARLLSQRVAPERLGLARAMLLGARDQLDDAHNQDYFLTGMVHVLSISGLHVGLLALGLFWLLGLGLLARRPTLALVALVTLAYAVLIGAEAPALRATIIVLVACCSLAAGRRALEFNSLAAAGLVVLAMNPTDLFRAGPQLSFLAAALLAWLAQRRLASRPAHDPLARLIASSRPWIVRLARDGSRTAGQVLVVTLAVWAVSLPLVTWDFHMVSPAALLLTPLLALPFSVGLFAGLVLVFLGWIAPPLAAAAGWLCDHSLAAGDAIVHWAVSLPASHLWIAGPAGWWVAGFYGLTLLWAAGRHRWPRPSSAALVLVSWSIIGLAPRLLPSRPDGALVCTFLSVGHGCATVVESPD